MYRWANMHTYIQPQEGTCGLPLQRKNPQSAAETSLQGYLLNLAFIAKLCTDRLFNLLIISPWAITLKQWCYDIMSACARFGWHTRVVYLWYGRIQGDNGVFWVLGRCWWLLMPLSGSWQSWYCGNSARLGAVLPLRVSLQRAPLGAVQCRWCWKAEGKNRRTLWALQALNSNYTLKEAQ